VVLISLSLGGSGAAFDGIWTGQIPFLPFLGNFPQTMRDLGGIHIHMVNSQILADTAVYIDNSGNKHLGAEIVSLLKDKGSCQRNLKKCSICMSHFSRQL
jgi:hypothetical protein